MVISQTVQELSRWQTNKQTNKQTNTNRHCPKHAPSLRYRCARVVIRIRYSKVRPAIWILDRFIAKWIEIDLIVNSYRRVFKKTALEAENEYFKNKFDTKANSVEKLWSNLNTVCSISKKKSMKNIINVLNVNGCKIEDKNDIPLIIILQHWEILWLNSYLTQE